MSREQGPTRLGIDLGVLEAVDDPMTMTLTHPDCPGAMLRVTHEMAKTYQDNGARFAEEGTFIPPEGEGFGPARVFCRELVAAWKGAAGNIVYGGRCGRCGDIEKGHRQMLRGLAKKSGGST